MIIGALIYTVGLDLFLVPNNIIDGGVVGISLMTAELTGISFSIFVVLINIPFLYIGSILYIDLQDPMVYFMYASSMNVNILFAELVLLLVSLLVFVFYLYPRDLAYKGVRLLRIVITAAMWLAMNAHILYGGYIPEFILSLVPTVFPTYQGNPLIFITPALLEAGMIGVAVIIGALVERGIISRRRESI